jgi:hypothetical protein
MIKKNKKINIINLNINKRKIFIFLLIFLIIFVVHLDIVKAQTVQNDPTFVNQLSNTVFSGVGFAIATIVGIIAYIITAVMGLLLTVLIAILVQIAAFNNIINVPPVVLGWVIVRDMCNMFFILALLVIAFATILRQESYSAKRLLPKLLIMAILINFSKTIFGLIIDFSQVIMLTFVNAFKEGGGWFIQLFQTKEMWSFDSLKTQGAGAITNGAYAADQWGTMLAMIAGIIASIMTVIIVAIMLAVLVMRIVMLWIYTILSPFVFLGFAFPPIQRFTGQIWQDFTKQVIIGPMLAFFIWLALTVASIQPADFTTKMGGSELINKDQLCGAQGGFMTQFFCKDELQKFVIVIGLLVGGIMVTMQMGGAIGQAAGKAQNLTKAGLRWGGRQGWRATKSIARETSAQIQKSQFVDNIKGGFNRNVGAKIPGSTAPENLDKGGVAKVGRGIGNVAGFLTGIFSGRKITESLNNNRKVNDERHKASEGKDKGERYNNAEWNEERGVYEKFKVHPTTGRSVLTNEILKNEDGTAVSRWGEYTAPDKSKYRRASTDDDKYYKVNSVGEFVDKDGNVTEDAEKRVEARGAFDETIKAMDENQAKRWERYTAANPKGSQIKDEAKQAKVEKLQSEYGGLSKEMLRRLLEVEKDSSKRMAIAMSLAIRKGFVDARQVISAKGALQGNSGLQSKFDSEMNKRHMIWNNSKKDANGNIMLDKGEIAKGISKGDFKWEDQDWATHSKESIALMADQKGPDFHKSLNSSIRTDKDKAAAIKVLGEDLATRGYDGADLSVRKSYGSLTGNFLNAFSIKLGEKIGDTDKRYNALVNAMRKIDKAEVFDDVGTQDMSDETFRKAFQESVNISMLKKIANNLSSEKTNQYMKIAAENDALKDKMDKDSNLRSYV